MDVETVLKASISPEATVTLFNLHSLSNAKTPLFYPLPLAT